jgi:hypothetical protein
MGGVKKGTWGARVLDSLLEVWGSLQLADLDHPSWGCLDDLAILTLLISPKQALV